MSITPSFAVIQDIKEKYRNELDDIDYREVEKVIDDQAASMAKADDAVNYILAGIIFILSSFSLWLWFG